MFFKIYREDGRIKIDFFGLKLAFKNIFINRLRDCCSINNIEMLKKKGTIFPHPIGIVIGKQVEIGKNCVIYQNVTIGQEHNALPKIGDNVCICAGAILLGDITIGNNVIIGAGSVVTKSIPDNAVVVGNPAKIIKYREENI